MRTSIAVLLVGAVVIGIAARATAGAAVVDLAYAPTTVAQGGTVDVSGTCLDGGVPSEVARVHAFIHAGQPGAPFDHAAEYPVQQDGSFAGDFVIPSNAPPGEWTIGLECSTGDAVVGQTDEGPLTVTGELVAPPPPAPPVSGPVNFTG